MTVPDVPLLPVSDFSVGDQSSEPAPSRPPEIDGYLIFDRLGEGGMGSVWRAKQIRTDRTVALKFVKNSYTDAKRLHLRFQQEIAIASKLEHRNIARLYDTGLDRGYLYYSMQLVEGQHLISYFESAGSDLRERLNIFLLVCRAVDYAHEHGVIHRDLKPSNILVGRDNQPYVLDFGLAKGVDESAESRSMTGGDEFLGTLPYMAPEQLMGQQRLVTTRTDVHALGLLLWEILTGHPARDSKLSKIELIKQVTTTEIPLLSAFDRKFCGDLESIVAKATAFDVERRYISAGALADDIERYTRGEPVLAKPLTFTYFARKRLRKHRREAIAVALVMLVFVAMATVGLHRISSESTRAEIAATDARQSLYFNSIAWADAERSLGDLEKARELLSNCPTEWRNWEWRLLWSALDESVATIHQGTPTNQTLAMAVDEESGTLSFIDTQGTLWRSHLSSLEKARPYGKVALPGASSPQLSEDGATAAWKVSQGLIVSTSAEPPRQLSYPNEPPIERFALHPDGKTLATAQLDGQIKITNKRGDVRLNLKAAGPPRLMLFSRHGHSLLLIGAGVDLIDLKSGKMSNISASTDVRGAAFSRDGRTILLEHDSNGMTMIPLDGSSPLTTIYPRQGDLITYVSLNAVGTKVACGWKSGRITVWDWQARKEDVLLCGHSKAVRNLVWTKDKLISCSVDGTVRAWDSNNPAWRKSLVDGRFDLQRLVMSGDSSRIAWVDDHKTIRVFDRETGGETQIARAAEWDIIAMSLNHQGQLLATVDSEYLTSVWNEKSEKIFERELIGVDAVVMSPDGAYLATSSWTGDEVTVWTLGIPNQKAVFKGRAPIAWSSDSRLLCFVEATSLSTADQERNLHVYDLNRGEKRGEYRELPANSTCLAFNPTSTAVIAATNDGRVLKWHLGTATLEWNVKAAGAGAVFDLVITPDGTRVITAGSSLEMLDCQQGKPLLTLDQSRAPYTGVRFNDEDESLITANLNAIERWGVQFKE